MTASKQDLEQWFEAGVAGGAKYMVVICDTFDHNDYPCYCATKDDAAKKAAAPGDMLRAMEVYDLTADMVPQMNVRRAWAI